MILKESRSMIALLLTKPVRPIPFIHYRHQGYQSRVPSH